MTRNEDPSALNLTVNGRPHPHTGAGTLSALIAELGAQPERVAVMVNGRVVPRDQWSRVALAQGDQVEIVTFMGGG